MLNFRTGLFPTQYTLFIPCICYGDVTVLVLEVEPTVDRGKVLIMEGI